MSAPVDAMDLPLDGMRVVEASAGTGKTFTIATLYLRLILERGLGIDEIVVATFTRAAAAELGMRLRERLVLAERLLRDEAPGTAHDDDDGAVPEMRRLIALALQRTDIEILRERARAAQLAIDTAFIGTLHGFCHRILAEYGFETGQALATPELIEDMRELETEIVRDFWRRGSADPATAALLVGHWGSPESLAGQVCDPRWRERTIEVPRVDTTLLEAELASLRKDIAAWSDAALAEADTELRACFSHHGAVTPRCKALRALREWAAATPDENADASALIEAERFLPAACEKPASFIRHPAGEPFADIQRLCACLKALGDARTAASGIPAADLLRDARTFLDTERAKRLTRRNLMGHDEAVHRLAAALDDRDRGAAAAARIRARWKAALVDEFQDTDTRQWNVLRALFGASTLVLVGDPKQAIYGFRGGDVYAWFAAHEEALESGEPLTLCHSHRAGAGFCHALNALFSHKDAFIERGIEHPDVESARPERAVLRDGKPLAALQLWWLDPETVGHAERSTVPSKAYAQPAIQRACVAWIQRMLDGRSQLRWDEHGGLEPLRAKHIAVLVDSNDQAAAMQAALGRAGVAAASNLRASVFASAEAADLALLLEALAAPDDARPARAAHASLVIGADAAMLAAASKDDGQAALLERVAGWAAAVRRRGPLPWLHALLQGAAPRVLALPDGERRMANYLQLAELLQDLHAQCFGMDDLLARFAHARAGDHGDTEGDAARLRLDTDADAVTVATVHAAKGLEYPVVLLPYAVLARDPAGSKRDSRPPLYWYHDARAAHVAIGAAADPTVKRAHMEIRAEDVRKFYVAVTRAAALCVLPYGPTTATRHSAPFHLLHEAGSTVDRHLDDGVDGCKAALQALCDRAGGHAECVELPDFAGAGARHADVGPKALLRARAFGRDNLERDWQVWSFSRLVRGAANAAAADPQPGSGDGGAATVAPHGLGGARFGTAVHAALEQADFGAWREGGAMPAGERERIERALHAQGLAEGKPALREAVDLVAQCIGNALRTTLPGGVRLCDVGEAERRAEIEFHMTLAPAARADELYALLHRHGYQRQRSGIAPATLHGLMTGKIDLTFRHGGRFHIVDWKTNRCASFDETGLATEIAAHDYDLQWLIYTLALHRWLGRSMPDYDYERHVGPVYYLFVRGMGEGGGVYVDRPPRGLIEEMDRLFGGAEPAR